MSHSLWASTACYRNKFTYCRILIDGKIKEDAIGRACSWYGRAKKLIYF
jgi:hypothetical protein